MIKISALSALGEELMNIILNFLEKGEFKSILRRSSGIPHAIICLLKSEPYGQKAVLFPKALSKLLSLDETGETDGIKVHSFNILK